MHRKLHKHGRRSYVSVGTFGDSQSLLEREPLRSKDRGLFPYNIDSKLGHTRKRRPQDITDNIHLNDNKCNTLAEDGDIKKRWSGYYSQMLNETNRKRIHTVRAKKLKEKYH